MSQKILITGSNGGFGKLSVISLLKNGFQVAATMRDINGRNKAVNDELTALGAYVIEMDVTNNDSVASGINEAVAKLGGLDVVINNAGVGTNGMVEFYSPEDFQKLFDINVFGVQRVNRATVPLLRKQGHGLIIYVSSLLGRVNMPFYGLYQSSKWALEGLAGNYRVELSGFGIENCIVEPGGYPTTFVENLMLPSDRSRENEYGDFINMPKMWGQAYGEMLKNNPQQDPQRVAEAIVDLINKPFGEKPFRTTVDFIGMGEYIEKYNEHLEQIMQGFYTNIQMSGLLQVKK